MKTLEYKNETERQKIIKREIGKGLTLNEEKNHEEGNFLVFITPEELAVKEKKDAITSLVERDKSGTDVRLFEDLMELLLVKGVFIESELPHGAQTKLNKRRELRAKT